jgi:hypothetical protein
MNALQDQTFENFWVQSGTPMFLIEEFKRQLQENPHALDDIQHLESLQITQESLGIFDVGLTPPPALLFQTGYLTIVGYDPNKNSYRLGYPNQEVARALQVYLLSITTNLPTQPIETLALNLYDAFVDQDFEGITNITKKLFAHIPHQIKPRDERDYHALLQMALTAAGLRPHAEYSTSHGRADIIIELPKMVYVIEVKLNVDPAIALAQIEQRKYYERFTAISKKVILLGISFITEKQTLDIQYAMKIIV